MKIESNLEDLNLNLERVNQEINNLKKLLLEQKLKVSHSKGSPLMLKDDPEKPEGGSKKQQFRTEKDMIEYYEVKAVDAFDNLDHESPIKQPPQQLKTQQLSSFL